MNIESIIELECKGRPSEIFHIVSLNRTWPYNLEIKMNIGNHKRFLDLTNKSKKSFNIRSSSRTFLRCHFNSDISSIQPFINLKFSSYKHRNNKLYLVDKIRERSLRLLLN